MNNQKSNSSLSSSNNKSNSNKANNSANTVSSLNKIINSPVDTAKSNPVTAIVIGLILVVLLYTAFSYAYSYYLSFRKAKVTTKTLLAAAHSGSAEYDVGSGDMATSSYSNEYALSFWIYVDDFNYRQGQRKFIMRRGNIKTKANPEIYLHPNDNKLQVNVSLMTSNVEPTTTTSAVTSTTAPPETTSTTAPPATTASVSPFTDMSASVNQQFTGKKSSGTCDCPESNSAPNSAAGILNEIASNNPNIPATYYPDYFNMVSGNEVPAGEMPFMMRQGNYSLASVLGLSKDSFTDAPATGSCVCPPESSAMETDADRRDFEANAGKCIVDDFPLQKWVHVVVSQYNQVLDIYIDGKLRSSCVLPGFPEIVQDDLVICPDGGFGGMISKVEYTNSILSAKDVYNIYSMGPEAQPADILSTIPTWAWVIFVILVVGALGYSLTK